MYVPMSFPVTFLTNMRGNAGGICVGNSQLSATKIYIQVFLILGVAGFPSTWWDVLTLDLNLGGLLRESSLGLISVFGTVLAFVRPTIPGDCPRILRILLPVVAWFFFSDEATVVSTIVRGED